MLVYSWIRLFATLRVAERGGVAKEHRNDQRAIPHVSHRSSNLLKYYPDVIYSFCYLQLHVCQPRAAQLFPDRGRILWSCTLRYFRSNCCFV